MGFLLPSFQGSAPRHLAGGLAAVPRSTVLVVALIHAAGLLALSSRPDLPQPIVPPLALLKLLPVQATEAPDMSPPPARRVNRPMASSHRSAIPPAAAPSPVMPPDNRQAALPIGTLPVPARSEPTDLPAPVAIPLPPGRQDEAMAPTREAAAAALVTAAPAASAPSARAQGGPAGPVTLADEVARAPRFDAAYLDNPRPAYPAVSRRGG
ncbi:MAG: hypothetical protein RL722_1852, partial [Pseudomonadota bacterium]